MQEPNLNQTYSSTADSIHNFFDWTEEGLVIPAYQREYTWEEDNVNQSYLITCCKECRNSLKNREIMRFRSKEPRSKFKLTVLSTCS